MSAAVVHRLHIPPVPLSRFVRCFWYWEGAIQTHAKERLMPTGEATIIFNLRDEAIRIYDWKNPERSECFGSAVLAGPRREPFVIDTEQQERVFGIQFRAGGIFPFLRMPCSEAENRDVALDCAWRSSAGEIRERLLEAESVDAMFAIMQDALLDELAGPLELHPAVVFATHRFCSNPHRTTVAAVLSEAGLSHRRFVELFHRQVGLTPKAFCRVQRFQRVLRHVHGSGDVEWSQLALNCGYYDQSHFIHDFQTFSGFTPTAYASMATEHLNHVPLT
jgi:AraC-like DNA-binding protein